MVRIHRRFLLTITTLLGGWLPVVCHGGWLDDIGHTRLVELGIPLPAAASGGLSQIEASNGDGHYLPNVNDPRFIGKTFTVKSGSSEVSNHANRVGLYYYGSGSLLTGAFGVDLYQAGNWLDSGFLRRNSRNLPRNEPRAVQNHSWISLSATDDEVIETNRRLDYAIHNQGFIAVVGVNNGNSTDLPQLLGQAYHVISVGRSDGQHSAGFTTLDGNGRIKPEIVGPSKSPDNATSWTTPMVAGAAAMLHRELSSAPHSLAGADLPRVVKALLLASATKDTLPSWSNTSSRPLDIRYGAGVLNLHHAWHAMLAGKAASSNATWHGPRQWAAEQVPGNSSRTWYFRIPADSPATPFSAALTWHRSVTYSSSGMFQPYNWNASLANLDLRLHQANGFNPGTQLALSASTVDNVELVQQPLLPPGDYALVVQNNSGTSTQMALAWHSLPGVSIATDDPVAREIDGKPATITLTRHGDTGQPLIVPLSISGDAIPGAHYEPLPASVTIPAGESTLDLTVVPVSDMIAQGERTLAVSVAADFALARNPSQAALVTIEDKPFDQWRFDRFTAAELADPSISGATADPDGDGLPNLVEYALGLEPKHPEPSPVGFSIESGFAALSADKSTTATDIVWAAEVSSDLVAWQPAEVVTDTATRFEARDTETIDDFPRRFIRLKMIRD